MTGSKLELWDGLSITEVKADEREEGLGLRPQLGKAAQRSREHVGGGAKYNRSRDKCAWDRASL